MSAHDMSLLVGALWVVFVIILMTAIYRQHRARMAMLRAEFKRVEREHNKRMAEFEEIRLQIEKNNHDRD